MLQHTLYWRAISSLLSVYFIAFTLFLQPEPNTVWARAELYHIRAVCPWATARPAARREEVESDVDINLDFKIEAETEPLPSLPDLNKEVSVQRVCKSETWAASTEVFDG